MCHLFDYYCMNFEILSLLVNKFFSRHAGPNEEGIITTMDILEDNLVIERNFYRRLIHMKN